MTEKTEFMKAAEGCVQWGIPFKFLLANKFLFLFSSYLASYHILTYKYVKDGTILDAGCGMGLPVMCFRALGVKSKIIGLDPCYMYLQALKKREIYDELILGSVTNPPFRNGSFDTAIFLQVLEHLTRKDGLTAIRELMRVAQHIVLTTPVGFVPHEVDPGTAFQTHKSGWYPEELIRMGFKVVGYGWLKLTLPRGSVICVLCLITLNIIFEPLLRFFPNLARFMHASMRTRSQSSQRRKL